jgi:uncharacterized membrane protein YuzA (DUF378 family)
MLKIVVVIAQFFVFLGALALGVLGFTGVDPLKAVFGSTLSLAQSTIGIAAVVLIMLRFM